MKKRAKRFSLGTFKSLIGVFVLLASTFVSCKKDSKPEEGTKLVYVANEEAGTVSVIDADKGQQIKVIDLMDGSKMFMAHNVQVAPNGKSVWVTAVPENMGDDEQVIVINTADNTVKARIKLGMEQHLAHVVLDDLSDFAYVTANESNQVIKIDANSYTEIKRFTMDSAHQPHGLRFANGKLYVACMNAKGMAVIDVATEQMSEISLGGVAVQTAITPDGKFAFASKYDTRDVAMLNLQTQQITNIPLPAGSQGPIQMYPTPDSKYLYICDQGVLDNRPASNKVYVYDIAGGMIMNTITVGNAAHGVVVNNLGTRAYVTNSNDNTVSEIDVTTNTVIKTIPVGKSPNGISYWYKSNGVTGGMK